MRLSTIIHVRFPSFVSRSARSPTASGYVAIILSAHSRTGFSSSRWAAVNPSILRGNAHRNAHRHDLTHTSAHRSVSFFSPNMDRRDRSDSTPSSIVANQGNTPTSTKRVSARLMRSTTAQWFPSWV